MIADVVRRLGQYVGRFGSALTAVACFGVFAIVLHHHIPIDEWLVWRYASLWLLTGVWMLACASIGMLALRGLGPVARPFSEHLAIALPVGVLLFALGLFLSGLAGGLGPTFFWLYPIVLILLGLPVTRKIGQSFLRHARAARRRGARRRAQIERLAILFGLAGLVLLYLPLLTPQNALYDARWYHLPVAEYYASAGRIEPFQDGAFTAEYPHLASWLYTWAFLLPGGSLWMRIELAAHVEFALLLATLAAVCPLVNRLVARPRIHAAWVGFFLFPGILLRDSNLALGADHVLAFWAAPIALVALRVWQRPSRSSAVVLGALMAGATLTKYQALYLLPLPVVAIVVSALRGLRKRPHTGKRAPSQLWLPLLSFAAVAALTAPHWAAKWLWYGNPLYPFAHSWFGGHPWQADTVVKTVEPYWTPEGSALARALETAKILVTFSFVPRGWTVLPGHIPVFGSLFTLGLAVLPFLRFARSRVWALVAAILAGIAFWYGTYHQDRYLQALLPWMVAVTVVVLALAWRRDVVTRAALVALVALQIAWSADLYFWPTQELCACSPVRLTVDMFALGSRDSREDRLDPRCKLASLAPLLPKDAKVLVHEQHEKLGLQRRWVTDTWGQQGAISYSQATTATEVAEMLHSCGVTHLVWGRSAAGLQRWGDDFVFYDFVRALRAQTQSLGPFRVLPLPRTVPPAGYGREVLLLGSRAERTTFAGLEERDVTHATLGCDARMPRIVVEEALRTPADYLVTCKALPAGLQSRVEQRYFRLFERQGLAGWVSRSGDDALDDRDGKSDPPSLPE
jgi:hypothetical protein